MAVPGDSHRIQIQLDVRGACWGLATYCGQRFRVEAFHEVTIDDDQPHWLDILLSERQSPNPAERPHMSFSDGPGGAFWKD